MTESAFQKQVIDLAHLHGWRVAHFKAAQYKDGSWATPVQADGKGFPDLVLVRDRVVFAELKSKSGSVRPDQHAWMVALSEAGATCFIWRPDDLEEIHEVLK